MSIINNSHRLVLPLALVATLAHAEPVQRLDAVDAVTTRTPAPPGATVLRPSETPSAPYADASSLVERAPGASVVRNGGLTGIAQLRGLFNERVRIDIDGMNITPACPNHMDPPLHYTAPIELDHLVVSPGLTSVSAGGDSIAGTIQARSIDPEFFAAGEPGTRGEAAAGYNGQNDAATASVRLEAGAERYVLSASAAFADAGNTRIDGGEIATTGYTNQRGGVRLDAKTNSGRALLEIGVHRSEEAGTPTLPMDMITDDADRIRFGYRGTHRAHELELNAYWHDIEHLMDNFRMRPNSGMRMEAPSTSRDIGLGSKVARPAWGGRLQVGGEFHGNELDVFQRNVATGATQDTFNGATRDRVGIYGEWTGSRQPKWQTELGLRIDRIASDTGAITSNFMPSTPDRIAFNARGHDTNDTHFDATARWRHTLDDGLDLDFGIARKTRSPSLLERYLWTPLSASAGQADGRTYLGNIDLEPETSHQAAVGLTFNRGGLEMKPALFYNRVSDYIQGTPIARVDGNGKPVLQYQNQAAELYGIDGIWRWRLSPSWSLGGTIAFIHGENRDTGDNLYRIAPVNGTLYADHQRGRWTHRLELKAASRQDRVAGYNDEQPSAGWAVLNLHTQWRHGAWRIRGGLENLFDRDYHEHLSGINRVAGSDVAIGAAIPAAARHAYLEARYFW
ncbi:MAG: TonB-dependent receptor domain-containing protein [Thiotrichales bacterium]